MKSPSALVIVFAVFFVSTLGCKNDSLSKIKAPKSKCAVNSPELNSADEYVARGMNKINQADYECAFDDCQKALDKDEKNADAFVCRGYIYQKREEFSLAENDFDAAINLEPNNGIFLSRRIELYRQLGKNDLVAADEGRYKELLRAEGLPEETEKKSQKIEDNADDDIGETTLNDKAVSLPKPVYPLAAKAVKAAGEVKVRVSIDSKGNVTSATAVSGHPLLRASAEQAARAAEFKATAMTGILSFNFVAP